MRDNIICQELPQNWVTVSCDIQCSQSNATQAPIPEQTLFN